MKRALVARPVRSVPVTAVLPYAEPTPVMPGHEYELRTDAEVIDDGTGAVSYPLCYVVEGMGGELEADADAMIPFHKLSPVTVIPQASQLYVASTVACTIWICRVAPPNLGRVAVPGGAGCGCAKCARDDDDEEEKRKRKKTCGCGA